MASVLPGTVSCPNHTNVLRGVTYAGSPRCSCVCILSKEKGAYPNVKPARILFGGHAWCEAEAKCRVAPNAGGVATGSFADGIPERSSARQKRHPLLIPAAMKAVSQRK